MSTLLKDYDFVLPEDLIAQNPAVPRDHSRLLHAQREGHTVAHRHFYDLPKLLRQGDVLVFNNTRVCAARVFGQVEGMEAPTAEVLLLRALEPGLYRAMVRPGKRFKLGKRIRFSDTTEATIEAIEPEGTRLIRFDGGQAKAEQLIAQQGKTPLPPYIRHSSAKPEQYQTVYAKSGASVAAPTAGLHFTEPLLDLLKQHGVALEYVTLEVERGTFLPVSTEDIRAHTMHSERFCLDAPTAERMNAARAEGRRLIAVGTTSVRVIESACDEHGVLHPCERETQIFIYPGYRWKCVGGLITNFHLPKSSLLMLVSAFAGVDFTRSLYQTAIEQRYRFYSFGDAMFIE